MSPDAQRPNAVVAEGFTKDLGLHQGLTMVMNLIQKPIREVLTIEASVGASMLH